MMTIGVHRLNTTRSSRLTGEFKKVFAFFFCVSHLPVQKKTFRAPLSSF